MRLCGRERSVQILVDLKTHMKFKIDSTGDRALLSPRHQEDGMRTSVWLMLVSKDTFPRLFTHSIFIKIMTLFMTKFIKT